MSSACTIKARTWLLQPPRTDDCTRRACGSLPRMLLQKVLPSCKEYQESKSKKTSNAVGLEPSVESRTMAFAWISLLYNVILKKSTLCSFLTLCFSVLDVLEPGKRQIKVQRSSEGYGCKDGRETVTGAYLPIPLPADEN